MKRERLNEAIKDLKILRAIRSSETNPAKYLSLTKAIWKLEKEIDTLNRIILKGESRYRVEYGSDAEK